METTPIVCVTLVDAQTAKTISINLLGYIREEDNYIIIDGYYGYKSIFSKNSIISAIQINK